MSITRPALTSTSAVSPVLIPSAANATAGSAAVTAKSSFFKASSGERLA